MGDKNKYNLDHVHARLVALGTDWAEKDAAAQLLDETRRSVRAQIAMSYMVEAKTAAKAELMAEADERYVDHVKAMVEAKRKSNIARVNFDAAKAWLELLRTKEASRRAELQALRG